MTYAGRRSLEAVWIEPVAAAVIFGFALFVNRTEPWPMMWAVDLLACGGAALSRRFPITGAILTGLGLAFWLPFPQALPSMSGVAFYINVFAATRTNLAWKIPLTLGFGGLAYLTLVRRGVEGPEFRWTTSILLLIVLALAYMGGTAFRYAAHRVESERETGQQRLQDLRLSLARELHDSVAQTLSSAAMRANIAMSDPGLSPLTLDQLERIADECRASAHDLRQLLSALREEPDRAVTPGPLADVESLKHALHEQAERLRSEGFTADVDVKLTKLSAARCQTLAAIAVEATNNMVKHAKPGSRCSISIVSDEDDVFGRFTNVDKGAKCASQGFGLAGIQERLTLLDGTCAVKRGQGQWVLHVRLPLGMEPSGRADSPAPAPGALFPDDATA